MTRQFALYFGILFFACYTHAEESPPPVNTDPYLTCLHDVASDSQFKEIAAKLPLEPAASITFAMLADESRPTPKERNEIGAYFDKRDECLKASDAMHRAKWPPELYALGNEGSSRSKAIGADLYNRKITFGEANKQIEVLINDAQARIAVIVKHYQAEIAAIKAADAQRAEERQQVAQLRMDQAQAQARAQEAQEDANRRQRALLFLNYMRANQPVYHPVPMPQIPKTYTTDCNTSGSYTNCVTR
jgi:hypothetical protein